MAISPVRLNHAVLFVADLDLDGEVRRWSGVRTAGQITADADEARS